jgi:HK97 gp10 family phage protein
LSEPVKVEIHAEKLEAFIAKLPQAIQQKAQAVFYKLAEGVRDDAKRLVPVDTGSLQRSIRIENISLPAGVIQALRVRAGGYVTNPKSGKIVDYAAHVEYGTSRGRSQPFMRPAYYNALPNIARVTVDLVNEAVEAVAK